MKSYAGVALWLQVVNVTALLTLSVEIYGPLKTLRYGLQSGASILGIQHLLATLWLSGLVTIESQTSIVPEGEQQLLLHVLFL